MGRDEPSLEPSGGDLGGVHLAVPNKLGEWILVRCFPAKPRTGSRPKASKGRLPDLGVCALSQSHPEPSLLLLRGLLDAVSLVRCKLMLGLLIASSLSCPDLCKKCVFVGGYFSKLFKCC